MNSYYAFLPELIVSISSKYRVYTNYFNEEYWFAATKSQNSNVEVKIVSKLPKRSGNNIIQRLIHFKKLFWFEYLIDFDKNKVQIYFKHNPLALIYFKAVGPFIQTNLLEPVIYYLAVLKGYYFLHASTIEKKGKGVCFTGAGGAGKTLTALRYSIDKDYSFLGDDLIFVKANDLKLTFFPRPLHLFSYNISKIPLPKNFFGYLIFLKIFLIVKFKDIIRFVLSFVTKEKPLISTRIDVRKLYPKMMISKEAILTEIKWLDSSQNLDLLNLLAASDLRQDLLTIFSNIGQNQAWILLEKKILKQILSKVRYN